MDYLSKEFWLHWRINQRAFIQSIYKHDKIGQIVNNVLFKRKDETNKLKRIC